MNSKTYTLPNGKKAVFEYDVCGIGKITLECMDELMGMITAPSIDIVRCKECKHSSVDGTYGCMCNHFNDNDWSYHRMYADDFCSYGEREGE